MVVYYTGRIVRISIEQKNGSRSHTLIFHTVIDIENWWCTLFISKLHVLYSCHLHYTIMGISKGKGVMN